MSSVVTFGETMLRLSPPRGERLARTDSLDLHVGGAESNVAVAAATFDVEATWVSALPSTDLGERIVHALRGEGIEPLVKWTEEGRVGTYYFERGSAPRGDAVTYDRTGTPIQDVTPADLPEARIREADLFFTSGITPALSDRLAATTRELLSTASEAGVSTALDLNYRSKLWTPAVARETLTGLFSDVDVLFVAERDARGVLDYQGDSEAITRNLAAEHDFETVVLTQGAEGALAVRDDVYEQPAIRTETVDPVGSGDAFVGAYLAQRLDGATVPDALATGAATAALNRTVDGDMTQFSAEDVGAVLTEHEDTGIDR